MVDSGGMKKTLLVALLMFPSLVFAQTFDNNLSYGSTGSDVSALQEFLTEQGVYHGPISGNFYSLTLAGVKAFQTAESITPVSGFVGPITRGTINTILASEAPVSEEDASTTTLPIDLSIAPQAPVVQPQIVTPLVIPTQAPAIQTPVIQTPPPRNPPSVAINNSNAPAIISGTDVVMDTFTISVSSGDEGAFLTSIPLILTLHSGAKISDLTDCTLYDSSNVLRNGGGNIINGNSLNGFSSGDTLSFRFTDSLTIPSGTSEAFTLKCNVSPSSEGTYIWSIPNWNITGALFGDSLVIS